MLAEVADAWERQHQVDGGWAKVLTTGLGAATGVKTWWECSPLTWDPQFKNFVSADPEDGALSALTVSQAIDSVDTGEIGFFKSKDRPLARF